MKTALFGAAVSAAALAFAMPAAAQQSQTLEVRSGTTSFRAVTVASFDPIGQSFTAFSDTITSVGFQFVALPQFPAAQNLPLSLSIYAGESLTGTALYATTFAIPPTVNNRDTPVWVDVAIPNLAITNGQTYSLILQAPTNYAALVLGPGYDSASGRFFGGDAYAGGRLISAVPTYSNCAGASNNCDANFRVTGNTFAAAVPEPSAWALLILGFAVIGSGLRASRKTRVQLNFA